MHRSLVHLKSTAIAISAFVSIASAQAQVLTPPRAQPSPSPNGAYGGFAYHAGLMCGTGASYSSVAIKPTEQCGGLITLMPFPIPLDLEAGVMGPQANRSFVSGYLSANTWLPLMARSPGNKYAVPLIGQRPSRNRFWKGKEMDTSMIATSTVARKTLGEFLAARRINCALTASTEKRVLLWMAQRAPRWITSDQLTVLGLAAQFGAGICYALSRLNRYALLGAIVCLALNWLGDSMDGTLARVRCQQRPRYGFYVDHIADIFGSTALMCGIGCSGFLQWQTAMAMLVAFLLLSSESYLATYTLGCFELSQGIFGPTEIRILLIIGSLALLRSPYSTVFGHRMLLFDLGGTVAAASMFAMVIWVAARHIAQLYKAEPLP